MVTAIAAEVIMSGKSLSLDRGPASPGAKTQDNIFAGITRTETLPPRELSVAGREISQSVVELPPGTSAPRHFHPGEEVIYVIQGTWEYDLDGQPPVIVKTGQSFLTPHGVVHEVRNVGSDTAIGLSTWVAEKGKPLTTLAK
jgi:quercetin dioxygenase-like cupin family protein